MQKFVVGLCLLASPAVATEPPDWYAHIPAEQRAALLAARHAAPPRALIGSESPLPYRGPASAAYAAPQSPASFDASALVHGPQENRLHRLVIQDRERSILREYMKPGYSWLSAGNRPVCRLGARWNKPLPWQTR